MLPPTPGDSEAATKLMVKEAIHAGAGDFDPAQMSPSAGSATRYSEMALVPLSYRIQGMADPSNSISIDASP